MVRSPKRDELVVLNEQVGKDASSSASRFLPWFGIGLVVLFVVALGAATEPLANVAPIEAPAPEPPRLLAVDPLVELRGPAFGEQAGVILVFDDGLDGLLYVDPDRRIATRHSEGLTRQSRRAQLDQVGDSLVVGGVVTEVVSLTTRDSAEIPPSSYHLIAPDGTLWLVDVLSATLPVGSSAVTRVSIEGETLVATTEPPIRGLPAAAVGDELVLDTSEGLYRWNPVTDGITDIALDGSALVLGASGSRLAWCPHDCVSVFVEDFDEASTVEIVLPVSLGPVDHTTTAWSPDGTEFVVVTTEAVVRIASLATTPEVIVLTQYAIGAGAPRHVAWDPSGDYVFFATDSPRGRLTGMWRSDGTRLGTGTTTLPFSGAAGPFVVLDAAEAGWMVGDELGAYLDCPAPAEVQLPEPKVCSFRF